jgi:hypothetical protein
MITPTLVDKLVAISTAAGHVAKTGKNASQGFNFRGIDAVVNALSNGMRNSRVIVYPTVLNYQYEQIAVGQNKALVGHVRLEVRYTFTDGIDSISAVVSGEAMDSGDKATAKAMSVAFRTALLQVFFLPTDEKDPDEDSFVRASSARANHPSAPAPVVEDDETDHAFPSKPSRPSGLATEKQRDYIRDLAKKRGYDAEISNELTFDEASQLINELKSAPVIK